MSLEDRTATAGGAPSILSSDLKIVGNLKSDGEIQIDGAVKGDIKGHVLTVGEQGKIDGSIVADTVRIFGTVNGRVEATTVHLDKSARVTADITFGTLAIAAGAYFEGKVGPLKGASTAPAAKL